MVYLKYNTPFTRILNYLDNREANDDFSALVHETDLHLYNKILPITKSLLSIHLSTSSEGDEIYNRDKKKFSILGASFTGIVKNTGVLSHRCDTPHMLELLQICRMKYM